MNNGKMVVAMSQEDVVCIWSNGISCPVDQKDKFVAVHGDDFLYAILLDEGDVVDLSESINQFWKSQKSLALH